jgi:AraC family transcriptional activator of pobA
METHLIKYKIANNAPSFKAEYYELDDEPKNTNYSRRDFYKIWLINNKGLLHLPDQIIHIDNPAIVYLNPLIPYTFEPVEKDRTGYWCIFTEEFLNSNTRNEPGGIPSLFSLDNPGIYFLNAQNRAVVNFLFEQIALDFNSDYPFKYESIKDKIALLIHEGNKMKPVGQIEKKQNAASRITSTFLNLLEKQYPIANPEVPLKLRKPSDFAQELAIHVNHLNAVVQEITGKSTRDHIAGRMISESKALLNFSDWNVADIAYSLGFDYPNHFITFFKKHTGITPTSLRK